MTSQQILVASLDYQRLMRKSGLMLTQPMIGVLNGQTEYLCAKAQVNGDKQPTTRRA